MRILWLEIPDSRDLIRIRLNIGFIFFGPKSSQIASSCRSRDTSWFISWVINWVLYVGFRKLRLDPSEIFKLRALIFLIYDLSSKNPTFFVMHFLPKGTEFLSQTQIFSKPISLQLDCVKLWYFKLNLFDLPEFIVWNI